MLITLSFALDKIDRELFLDSFRKYFNKVLPERIAISSLYRAFVFDFTRNPWAYVEKFDKFNYDKPHTSNYETYSFKCAPELKEAFYNNNFDIGTTPSALLRCFTYDFAINPLWYIERYGGKDAHRTNNELSPLQFFDL